MMTKQSNTGSISPFGTIEAVNLSCLHPLTPYNSEQRLQETVRKKVLKMDDWSVTQTIELGVLSRLAAVIDQLMVGVEAEGQSREKSGGVMQYFFRGRGGRHKVTSRSRGCRYINLPDVDGIKSDNALTSANSVAFQLSESPSGLSAHTQTHSDTHTLVSDTQAETITAFTFI